jgi:predicted Zn-dependent protease
VRRALAGAAVAVVGVLAGCQGVMQRAEKNFEENRRQIRREVSATKEDLGMLTSALTGCPLERRQAYELDAEQEYQVGRAVAAQQLAELDVAPLPPEEPLARYVEQVGQYVALVAEATGNASAPDRANRDERVVPNRPWPFAGYRFLVLPLEEPRATASPGGTVMVSTGLLRVLQSEEELAAVLAHEVAHVQRGHGVEVLKASMCQRAARKDASEALQAFGARIESNVRQNLGGAGIRSTEDASVLGELLGSATDTALELFKEGYPEDFELEADRMSVRHLVSAGYDPRALTWLLQRMAREAQGQDAYFRTHPPFKARLETVGTRLKALPPEQWKAPAEWLHQRTQRFLHETRALRAAPGAQAKGT